MKPAAKSRDAPAAGPEPDAAIRATAADWKSRLDAGLGAREQAEFEAWLEADPRHGAAFARIDAVWTKFDRPFEAGGTDDLLQAIAIRAGRRRRRRVISAGSAALLLFVATGSVWRLGLLPNVRQPPALAVAPPPAAANAVLLRAVTQLLPDGSIAELKNGAEITVAFSGEARRVVLRRGEVHFQVTKDPARPFIVAAGGIEARAVGTAFSVQLRADAVEVLVTEGRVAVGPKALEESAPSSTGPVVPSPLAVLNVGHGIVVNLGAGPFASPHVTAVEPEEIDERLAWRAPRVEFSRATLAEAIAVLNEYSAAHRSREQPRVRFVIEDPAVAGLRVSGLFRVDRTDAFIGLLKNGLGVDADRREEGEIVLRKTR